MECLRYTGLVLNVDVYSNILHAYYSLATWGKVEKLVSLQKTPFIGTLKTTLEVSMNSWPKRNTEKYQDMK